MGREITIEKLIFQVCCPIIESFLRFKGFEFCCFGFLNLPQKAIQRIVASVLTQQFGDAMPSFDYAFFNY